MKDVYYHMCGQKVPANDLYIWMALGEGRVGTKKLSPVRYPPTPIGRQNLKLKEFLKNLDKR